ncbi:MAG: phosphate ABC transporter permease PstA [Verrucomicrobiota bacterium]
MNRIENIFLKRTTKAGQWEKCLGWAFRLTTYLIILFAVLIFGEIFIKGGKQVFKTTPPFVEVDFLIEAPETLHVFEHEGEEHRLGNSEYQVFIQSDKSNPISNHSTYVYSAGGIFPCIVGTILLVVGAIVIALFLGIMSAIYLSEYSKQGAFIDSIRLGIVNLSGVPSIVFGLFGYALFVQFFGWNVSLMAGWFTLAFMVLPIVITASEESLRAVPMGFREASLALGATKWQSIRSVVLPYATPGILTSSILGITRIAGETAPIMFTAAYVVRDELPWQVERLSDFFFQGVMALPYHIYVLAAKIPQSEYTSGTQYGTCFVFLVVVLTISLASILLRAHIRKNLKW